MKIKYPRTFYLPWSPGITNDDKVAPLESVTSLLEKEIVITEKMDGECLGVTNSDFWARSVNSKGFGSLSRKKIAEFNYLLPEHLIIFAENLEYQHSINYKNTPTIQYFNLLDWSTNAFLSWDDLLDLCLTYNINTVPELFRGTIELKELKEFHKFLDLEKSEGYVIRNADKFNFSDFSENVFKFVRDKHVQTDKHWSKNLIKNG